MDRVDIIDTKRAATKVRRAVDFASAMEAGDTVQAGAVTAVNEAGGSVSAELIENILVSGTQVRWTYKAYGTVGARYAVRIVATTVGGDILPKVVRLDIEGA